LPASYIANKRWPYYRNLPPSLKAFGVVLIVVPSFIISGETAGRRFEQDKWRVIFNDRCGSRLLKKINTHVHRERANPDQVVLIKHREKTRWQNMTLSQKVVDFTARHQFSTIAGCWALGITGAFGAIMRNPCVSLIQGENAVR
jgi:hypothetical protein